MWKIVLADRLKELEDTVADQAARIDALNYKLADVSKINFELEIQNVSLQNVRKLDQRSMLKTKKDKD